MKKRKISLNKLTEKLLSEKMIILKKDDWGDENKRIIAIINEKDKKYLRIYFEKYQKFPGFGKEINSYCSQEIYCLPFTSNKKWLKKSLDLIIKNQEYL